MEEFDFVIVGGGPGGCVTASRLSEDPSFSVLLIEAGPDRRGFLATNTAAGVLALGVPKGTNNWGFETVVDPGLNHRRDYHPHGRGLGGGTSINTLMYMRGHRSDYDEWAAMGNPGWSYAEVLPYFRKAENNQTHRDGYHGNEGPLWVEELRTDNRYHAIVKRACAEAGLPFNPDFNGAEQEGFNSVQVMMKHGERHHVGQAYVHPHLGVRANLHLRCETECTRILVENRRAVGVEVVANGVRRSIRARREVILCAGGLLSAKLLQLSGIGDPEDFAPYGIVPVHVLPAVGRNLHDHIDVVLGYHIPGDPDLLGVSPAAGIALARGARRWVRERRGLLATNFAELTGFMRLGPDSPKPEIQYEFVIGLAMDHGRQICWRHGMSCHVMILHPKSRGTVRLSSPDHRADPLIDFRYFSNPDDLPTLAAGAQRTAQIFAKPSFRELVRRDLVTAHCRTSEDWQAFCRNGGGTNYHPVGSCRMGPSQRDSVVDARLRVHGLEGLRIVDSSIMPKICGGNTTAPTVMIAEKGAEMIREDWRA